MGLGIDIDCERCGEQCMVVNGQLKEHGDKHNLCPDCWDELRIRKWDRENNFLEPGEK